MSDDLFFGTTGPRNAKIMIVGEAWGSEEANQRKAFVGESGRELNKMLAEAGIARDECFATNIIAERPPDNELFRFFVPTKDARATHQEPVNGLFPLPKVVTGLDRLYRQVDVVKPQVIIGCGNYPFWGFSTSCRTANSNNPSGWKVPGGITLWRGSQLISDVGRQGYRFLPIFHPAAIIRNWSTRPIAVHDLRTRVPLALKGSWSKPSRHYIVPPTFRECLDYLKRLIAKLDRGPTDVAIDLETKGSTIACIGMTHDGMTALAIPFLRPNGPEGFASYWSFNEEKALVRYLREVLNHHNIRIIGQNFLYDAQYLSRWWRILPRVSFDTMLAQHTLFPGTPKALYYLASLYDRTFYRFWKEDSKEWEESGNLNQHLTYNCDDCFETWVVAAAQRDALTRMDLWPQFNFLLEQWSLAFDMMDRGIRIDQTVRKEMSFHVMEEAQKRQEWLSRVVPAWCRPEVKKGAKPWYNSPKQQMSLFYDCMGLKTVHHRKTGNPTVDDTALQEIKLRYPELSQLVDTIAELRSLGVFQNNFLSAAIDPDGRMRCSFNVAGPETYRWSSSENAFGRGTNLQNIPTGDE